MFGLSIWATMIIGGFVLLGLVMFVVMLRNKSAGVDEPVRRDGPPPSYDSAGNEP